MRLWAAVCALALGAGTAAAWDITAAEFTDPTDRYPHGVLGDELEWGNLRITLGKEAGEEGGLFHGTARLTYEMKLDEEFVYEDLEPRLWDITGDGSPEVVVVQSHQNYGARLVVIGLNEDDKPVLWSATPFIGERFRWVAPVGAADLDGDGQIEIAIVDRPHLTKTLRIWRYTNGELTEVAQGDGVSNHQIGWDHIPGGLSPCDNKMILASGDWTQVLAVRFEEGKLIAQTLGPYEGPDSLNEALLCE